MKRLCSYLILTFLLGIFIISARAQGLVSAKSLAVRVNTLPFFEAKTVTRAAAPEVVKGRTVWRETFTDNQHKWTTGKVKTGTFVLSPSGYQIQTDSRDVDASSLIDTPFDLNGNDFTVEATIENTGDAPPNVGLMVGGESDRFFVLRISYLSRFIAQYVVADKKPYTADDFVFNANVTKGSNKLKIAKTGGKIDFFINNEMVYTRLFQPVAGQQIGLIGAGHNITVKNVLIIGTPK